MAERFLFFNSATGDPRKYQAQDFAEYFGSVLSTGLLHTNEVPGMAVSVEAGTLNTITTPGKAIIKGHLYENTTPRTLTHSIPEPTFDRIDRIVLRLDLRNSERNILLHVKEGLSTANPVAPVLQRDNFIHEISLAQIRVRANTVQLLPSDLIDERLDENLAGLVHSLISIPTDQLQAFINAKRTELDDEMNLALDAYLTSLAQAEQQLQNDLANWNQQWTDWFTNIQGEAFVTGEELASQLADLASQDENKGASLVGFSANEMTATNVREGILEAFMLGNSRKQDLVDKLLLLDPNLPIMHESTWEEILLAINQVSTGKKWASGTAKSSASRVLTVRGLNFKPSKIMWSSSGRVGFFNAEDTTNAEYVVQFYLPNISYSVKALKSSQTIYDDGFAIMTDHVNSPGQNYIWWAYE